MNWDIYNLPLTLVCFSSTFSDDAADEHSDGSPEDGQDDAGVWEREHEDGHVRGHEWVHSTHLLICLYLNEWVHSTHLLCLDFLMIILDHTESLD